MQGYARERYTRGGGSLRFTILTERNIYIQTIHTCQTLSESSEYRIFFRYSLLLWTKYLMFIIIETIYNHTPPSSFGEVVLIYAK